MASFEIFEENDVAGAQICQPQDGKHAFLFNKTAKIKIIGGHSVTTVSPKLKFYDKLAPLRAQIMAIIDQVGEEGMAIKRIQLRDSEGDWIDMVDASYNSSEFEEVPKLYMQVEICKAIFHHTLNQKTPQGRVPLQAKDINVMRSKECKNQNLKKPQQQSVEVDPENQPSPALSSQTLPKKNALPNSNNSRKVVRHVSQSQSASQTSPRNLFPLKSCKGTDSKSGSQIKSGNQKRYPRPKGDSPPHKMKKMAVKVEPSPQERKIFQFGATTKSKSTALLQKQHHKDHSTQSGKNLHLKDWEQGAADKWKKEQIRHQKQVNQAQGTKANKKQMVEANMQKKRAEKKARIERIKAEKNKIRAGNRNLKKSKEKDAKATEISASHYSIAQVSTMDKAGANERPTFVVGVQSKEQVQKSRASHRRSVASILLKPKMNEDGCFPVITENENDSAKSGSDRMGVQTGMQETVPFLQKGFKQVLGKRDNTARKEQSTLLDGPDAVEKQQKRRRHDEPQEKNVAPTIKETEKSSPAHVPDHPSVQVTSTSVKCESFSIDMPTTKVGSSEIDSDPMNMSTLSSISDITGITGMSEEDEISQSATSNSTNLPRRRKVGRHRTPVPGGPKDAPTKKQLKQGKGNGSVCSKKSKEAGGWKLPESSSRLPAKNWFDTLRSGKKMEKTELLRYAEMIIESEKRGVKPGSFQNFNSESSNGSFKCGSTVRGGSSGEGDDLTDEVREKMEVLKAASGLDDEEIRWRIECARPGANACRIAAKNLEKAETAYDKWLYEASVMEKIKKEIERGPFLHKATNMQNLLGTLEGLEESSPEKEGVVTKANDAVPPLTKAIKDLHSFLSQHSKLLSQPSTVRTQIREAQEALSKSGRDLNKVNVFKFSPVLKHVVDSVKELVQVVSKLLFEGNFKANHLAGRIEVWKERWKNTPEYASELKRSEQEWAEAELDRNMYALDTMRSFIPTNIADFGVLQIQELAQAEGSFYPVDLCSRLKTHQLLHWLIMHPDDIATANFLQGQNAAAFTSLGGYDVLELRAIYFVLPTEFQLDSDGKKNLWRSNFVEHLKTMVRQETGATVRAGWDPVAKKRAETKLAPLSDRQKRDTAYFYQTIPELEARIKKIRDQHSRLDKRKQRLATLEQEIEEARKEVSDVCEDARDPRLKKKYGADTLKRLKDEAKNNFQNLIREQTSLKNQIIQDEKSLSVIFPNLEQLEDELEKVKEIHQNCQMTDNKPIVQSTGDEILADDVKSNESNKDMSDVDSTSEHCGSLEGGEVEEKSQHQFDKERGRIRIFGPFPMQPVLKKKILDGYKKLSAEEEAAQRREEMLKVTRNQGQSETQDSEATENSDAEISIAKSSSARTDQSSDDMFTGNSTDDSMSSKHSCQTELKAENNGLCNKRIGKVNIAPEVLKFLTTMNQDKSEKPPDKPLRRSKRLASRKQSHQPKSDKDFKKPKSPVKRAPSPLKLRSRSVRMLEKTKEEVSGNGVGNREGLRGPPSFLAELRNQSESIKSSTKPSAPGFLAEIRAKTGGGSNENSGKPAVPGFLAELRAKTGSSTEQNTKPAAPGFLAELVAKTGGGLSKQSAKPGAPNFLAELSAKTGGAKDNTACKGPPSFLSELQQKTCNGSNAQMPSTGSLSFLDELKAKAQSNEVVHKADGNAEHALKNQPSFLTELKMKTKKMQIS